MIVVMPVRWNQLTDTLWEKCEPYVQEGCDVCATEDASDVLTWVKERVVQLWLVMERNENSSLLIGVLITEIVNCPKANIMRYRLYGGRMNAEVVKAISEVVNPWAVAQGCDRAEVWGRPGWERVGRTFISAVRRKAVILQGDL